MSINSIYAAEKYSGELDRVFEAKSATAFFADNALRTNFVGAKTVIIPEVAFDGLSDYDRAKGFTDRNSQLTKRCLAIFFLLYLSYFSNHHFLIILIAVSNISFGIQAKWQFSFSMPSSAASLSYHSCLSSWFLYNLSNQTCASLLKDFISLSPRVPRALVVFGCVPTLAPHLRHL